MWWHGVKQSRNQRGSWEPSSMNESNESIDTSDSSEDDAPMSMASSSMKGFFAFEGSRCTLSFGVSEFICDLGGELMTFTSCSAMKWEENERGIIFSEKEKRTSWSFTHLKWFQWDRDRSSSTLIHSLFCSPMSASMKLGHCLLFTLQRTELCWNTRVKIDNFCQNSQKRKNINFWLSYQI